MRKPGATSPSEDSSPHTHSAVATVAGDKHATPTPTPHKPVWPKSVWPKSRSQSHKPDAELLSHADLLELTALGDYKAFARLYASVEPRVSSEVSTLLSERTPTEASATVVREVFVDVWQLAPQFEEIPEQTNTPANGIPVITGAESTAWILKVARRHAVDRLRHLRAQNRQPNSAEARPAPAARPAPGPSPSAQSAHSHPDCKLTTQEREAIALAFGGGYSEVEVAAILDMRIDTVRTRLHRGLLRLQVSPRAKRSAHHPADNNRRAQAELEECAPCHRSAQLLLEPSHRAGGEAAASILHGLTPHRHS
jgi:RNA polymerase sigma-70 factor (ECF subfamily)